MIIHTTWLLLSLALLNVAMSELGGDSDAYYHKLLIARRENCNDCFDSKKAKVCQKFYNRCAILKQSTDASAVEKARQEATKLVKKLEKESYLKDEQRDSGYCLNFQARICDMDKFCELDIGPKAGMTASYIGMVVAGTIRTQFQAESVDMLLVDVQPDCRLSESMYEKRLFEKLGLPYTPSRQMRVDFRKTGLSERTNGTRLKDASVAQDASAGYRTWTIHEQKNPRKNGNMRAVQKALDRAVRMHGKSQVLSHSAKAERMPESNIFTMKIMV